MSLVILDVDIIAKLIIDANHEDQPLKTLRQDHQPQIEILIRQPAYEEIR